MDELFSSATIEVKIQILQKRMPNVMVVAGYLCTLKTGISERSREILITR